MQADRSSSDESKKSTLIKTILILMPFLVFFLSLCIGRYQIEAGRTASILFSAIAHIKQAGMELEQSIVLDIRLPRALLAMMVGAGLAVSGAAFQGLFGNPLVSPHILGVSSGAGFGAAMGILLSGHLAMPGKNDRRVARNALESVGIGHLARRTCSELSGGERQLVMIARALAAEPEIIILDEPESHLDFRNQLMILDILESISQQREISCIINTHYPEHALRISDKTLILGKECDYVVGETEEVISEDNL